MPDPVQIPDPIQVPDPVIPGRLASSAVQNALRTGGTGGLVALFVYAGAQGYLMPHLHALFDGRGIDPPILTIIYDTVPASIAMAALTAVAWLGSKSRDLTHVIETNPTTAATVSTVRTAVSKVMGSVAP